MAITATASVNIPLPAEGNCVPCCGEPLPCVGGCYGLNAYYDAEGYPRLNDFAPPTPPSGYVVNLKSFCCREFVYDRAEGGAHTLVEIRRRAMNPPFTTTSIFSFSDEELDGLAAQFGVEPCVGRVVVQVEFFRYMFRRKPETEEGERSIYPFDSDADSIGYVVCYTCTPTP